MASDFSRSQHITDRSSKFVGYFSGSMSRGQLQGLGEIKDATHKMAAWRLQSRQTTLTQTGNIVNAGFDEDGEKGAGWRLKKLLEDENVMGVLVVARWYGGVMLGPRRWEHILDVAKEAITQWKAGPAGKSKSAQRPQGSQVPTPSPDQAPPQSLMTDDARRKKLIDELKDRDNSIAVLRKHLDDKKAALDTPSSSANPPTASQQSPSKSADYYSMPLLRLQALDKARDATLAYLLKELDKVDAAQKEEDELDAAFVAVSDRQEIADAWNAMEAALAATEMQQAVEQQTEEQQIEEQQRPRTPPTKRKRADDDEQFGDDADDEAAFEAAWEANEKLLSPEKDRGVQVNEDDLPPSPAHKRIRKLNIR